MKDEGTLDLFAESTGTGRIPPEETAGEEASAEEGAGEEEASSREPAAPGDVASDGADEGPRVWAVSEVNRAVKALLDDSIPPLWVGGEVANWTAARSGHRYFTLKDEHAQIRAVMWRGDAARLPADPEEGMQVRAYGSLTLYEVRGEYQLVARRLEAAGEEGLWKIAFEKLRRKLAQEGLLAPERKRPIPPFPSTVGVVTSTTGAALRDILSVLRRRAPWTRVVVRGARVQGEGAAEEVAAALRVMVAHGGVDTIIVGRGGGSIEDLWAFNEEPVARAVAECPVPVISAVGHETDVTISDLVADLRAPTPSAAAEAAVRDGSELLEVLSELRPRLARGLRNVLERRSVRVRESRSRIHQATHALLQPLRVGVERREQRLAQGIRRILDARRRTLAGVAAKVDALSPLRTLRRGYAVPLSDDGAVMRRARDFWPERPFELRVVDARVPCRVESEPIPEPEATRETDDDAYDEEDRATHEG